MKKNVQKTKKKIEISNEELARMIAEGFATVATKEDILLLNKRLDATKAFLESKIETSEMHLEGKIRDVTELVEATGETEISDLQNRMADTERTVRFLVKQSSSPK